VTSDRTGCVLSASFDALPTHVASDYALPRIHWSARWLW